MSFLQSTSLTVLVLIFAKNTESRTSNSSTVNDTEVEDVICLLTILPYPVHPNDSVSLRPYWDGGLAVLPAAQLAVEHINQDSNTLPGYRLELLNIDGGCNVFSKALMNFAKYVFYGPPIAGIIGPGCAPSSLATSSILGRPETALPNIHLATSPLLGDRNKYGNTYGIRGPSLTLVKTAITLVEHNKWDKVAALIDSDLYAHLSQSIRVEITHELEKNRVVFYSVVYDTYLPIDSLVKSSARVIVLFTIPHLALKLLCIAHSKGMVFPHYQWVIVGHHFDELLQNLKDTVFHYDRAFYDCSSKEIIKFLQNNLLIVHRIENLNKDSLLDSGHTYSDIQQHYLQRLSTMTYHNGESSELSIKPDVRAAITYDAVWALAMAMNMTVTTLNGSINISSIRYGNKLFTDAIKWSLNEIEFHGASGFIKFNNESGYTNRIVDIIHINSSMDDNLVGFLNEHGLKILTSNSQIFINTTIMSRSETVHPSVAAIFLFIILSLSTATFLLHILSTVKRKYPTIKASSPLLNHFIFTGCYIWTAASIIYIIVLKTLSFEHEQNYANCCHVVFAWLLPVGWTLIFGTLIMKTWRIYKIFVHFRNPGHLISNQALIAFVILQLGFDIIFGTFWSVLSPSRLQKTESDIPPSSTSNPQNYVTMAYLTRRSCVFLDSRISHLFWIVTVFGYKTLQITVLLTLALLTRKIINLKFRTFLLRVASYLSFTLFLSLLPPFIVLWRFDAEIHIDFVLLCTFISGTISICVTFVLLPPALPILRKSLY